MEDVLEKAMELSDEQADKMFKDTLSEMEEMGELSANIIEEMMFAPLKKGATQRSELHQGYLALTTKVATLLAEEGHFEVADELVRRYVDHSEAF